MKENSTSWKNVRDRHDFIGGTIEIFHEAFPGYPGNPEHWENRYYRAAIERVQWKKEGMPFFFLRGVKKFDRTRRCWVRPRIKFGRPLETYRKVREFSPKDIQLQLCRGVVTYEQPDGQCRIFLLGTPVPLFPDFSYERRLAALRREIKKGKKGKFGFLFR